MRLSSISSLSVVAPTLSPPRSAVSFAIRQEDFAQPGATTVVGRNENALPSSTPSDKLRDALTAFERESRMTPAERARRDILEDMELTEDELKAMPADKRNAIEDVIAKQIAKRIGLGKPLTTPAR